MALKDFPTLHKAFNELMAEKAALRAKSEPLRKKRDDVLAKMRPLEAQAAKIAEEYLAIERPRLSEIDAQLAAIARACGGKSLNS